MKSPRRTVRRRFVVCEIFSVSSKSDTSRNGGADGGVMTLRSRRARTPVRESECRPPGGNRGILSFREDRLDRRRESGRFELPRRGTRISDKFPIRNRLLIGRFAQIDGRSRGTDSRTEASSSQSSPSLESSKASCFKSVIRDPIAQLDRALPF